MSATHFPQPKPILVLLVKQVLLCPILCVCMWPCRCGLPLCRHHEPGLARGQCNCPTIAAVLFQFNKGVMRNNEVSALSWATCSWVCGSLPHPAPPSGSCHHTCARQLLLLGADMRLR